jgi:hypothetical protein
MTELRAPIVGSGHHPGAVDKLRSLSLLTPITLRREPNNQYDKRAIACYADDIKLGFIPRSHNGAIAPIMDAGKSVSAVLVAAPLIGGTQAKPIVSDPARMILSWE